MISFNEDVVEIPSDIIESDNQLDDLNTDCLANVNSLEEEKIVNLLILDKKKAIHRKCAKCDKQFTSKFNLKRHMTSCKLCPDEEKAPRFQCECGRTYAQEWDMKKHKVSCGEMSANTKCKKCPFCNSLYYHKLQLQAHMKSAHNLDVDEPQTYDFESIEDFKIWKEKIEEDTYTFYSKRTGGNVTGVSVNTYYVCQHDGSDRVHGPMPRKTDRRNKKGRVKTGLTCWSQMNVKEFRDGSVRVTYYPSHSHVVTAADTKHQPLPVSIRNEIARRVAETTEEPDQHFTDEKRTFKRKGPLSVRYLHALARKNRKLFRITAEAINDGDDMHQSVIDDEVNQPKLDTTIIKNEPVASDIKPEINSDTQGATLLNNCNMHILQLKKYLESGHLSNATLTQVESVLSSLLDSCRLEVLNQSGGSDLSLNAAEYPETPPGESNATLQLTNDALTMYQVVTLPTKEEPHNAAQTASILYQNSVELVGHREFILITHDPQAF